VLVKALARAWRWQKLLDKGVYGSVTGIAGAERISKSYVSRVLRLALLAPDLVEAILAGTLDHRAMPGTLGRPIPAAWDEQRVSVRGRRPHGRGAPAAAPGAVGKRASVHFGPVET
jgi:hypothetical protein